MSSEQGLLREIVMSLVLPLIKLCRTYEYTVKEVSEDGRLDLAPTKSKIAPKLTGVRQWAGAGTRAVPRRGSTVAVQFLDGDPARPVVTSFTPLGTQVGQPKRIEIDIDPSDSEARLVLARGELPVGRGGAVISIQQSTPPAPPAPGSITITMSDPDGGTNVWLITGAELTVAPVGPSSPTFTIDEGRAEVLV